MKISQLAKETGRHPDTFYKMKRKVSRPSAELAKELEKITGINRLKWLYPEEYGDPFSELDS